MSDDRLLICLKNVSAGPHPFGLGYGWLLASS